MQNINEVHDFAIRWLSKYRSPASTEGELFQNFEAECFALGFKMDCGEALESQYPGALQDREKFDAVSDSIEDVNLLTSAIFSKWRYVTYWTYNNKLSSPENRKWFIAALGRLAVLTSTKDLGPFIFDGQIASIRIKSNCVYYGSAPEPTDEVEQIVVISADGHASLSGYAYGDGEKYPCIWENDIQISIAAAKDLLDSIAGYFRQDYLIEMATDVGSWTLTLTNTEGEETEVVGSLTVSSASFFTKVSDQIRDLLQRNDLFLFDGNMQPDRIDRILVRYERETKIKSTVPFDNGSEYVTWNYAESIQIDRESETVEIYRKIAEECDTTYRYHVALGVSDFLDSQDANFLFKDIPGEPEDVIEDPLERKTYHIEVDYENQPSLILDGDFFRHTLPDDWEEFASDLHDFTSFYDGSELLNPEVYEKAKRRASELAFCSVEFAPGEKTYYYLDESDTCVKGDYVLVPVGSDGRTANVKVVNVEYYQPEEAPFPLNKIKRIIRKVGPDDLELPTVRCPLLGKNIDESDCVKISNVAEDVLSGETTERYDEPIDWTYEKAEQCADCDNHPYI